MYGSSGLEWSLILLGATEKLEQEDACQLAAAGACPEDFIWIVTVLVGGALWGHHVVQS